MNGPVRKPAPTTIRKTVDPVPKAPVVILPDAQTANMPRYLQAQSPDTVGYVPTQGARADAQQESLRVLAPKPVATGDQTRIATRARSESPQKALKGDVNRELDVEVSALTERGAITGRESFGFSIEPPEITDARPVSESGILGQPEEGLTYPVNINFTRSLFYADGKGRIVKLKVAITLGMLEKTWNKQAPGFGVAPSWEKVRTVRADSGTAYVTADGGTAAGEARYFSYAAVEMKGASFDELRAALQPQGAGSTLPALDLADPQRGAGNQFSLIGGWLDTIDAQRAAEAEAKKKKVPWYKRALLAIGGALYSFGNMFVEAGKQVWDMARLYVAAWGKFTGLWDYMPDMSSQIGKAAEEGQGTGQILTGMAKGMIEAPKNAWEAAKRDDWFGFGEHAFNSYMTGRTVEGLTRTGVRFTSRGVQALRGGTADPWAAAAPDAPVATPDAPAPGGTTQAPVTQAPTTQPTQAPVTGQAVVGNVGRHASQGLRGNAIISEHVTPGEIWRQILRGAYDDAHYNQDMTLAWERTAANEKTNVGPTRDITRLRDVQQRAANNQPIDVVGEVVASIDESLRAGQTTGSQVSGGRIAEAGILQLQEKFDMSPGRKPGARIRAQANAMRWLSEINDPNTTPIRRLTLQRKLAAAARNRKAELQGTGRQLGQQGGVADFEAFDWERTFSGDPNASTAPFRNYNLVRPEPAPEAPAVEPVQPVRPVEPPAPTPTPQLPGATADPVATAKARGGVFRVVAGLANGPKLVKLLGYRSKHPIDPSKGMRIARTPDELNMISRFGRVVGGYYGNGQPLYFDSTPSGSYWLLFQSDDTGELVLVPSEVLEAAQAPSIIRGLAP